MEDERQGVAPCLSPPASRPDTVLRKRCQPYHPGGACQGGGASIRARRSGAERQHRMSTHTFGVNINTEGASTKPTAIEAQLIGASIRQRRELLRLRQSVERSANALRSVAITAGADEASVGPESAGSPDDEIAADVHRVAESAVPGLRFEIIITPGDAPA